MALPPGQPAPDPNGTDARSYLRPNWQRGDGTAVYVHVTEADMPWRIAIDAPPSAPRYGSRADARQAAIEAMQIWEAAIRPHVPWFRLHFVERDPSAPVQVHWKRRMTGSAAGRGGLRLETADDRLRVGGAMTISTRPHPLAPPLTVDELRLLVAHEFGHVLGLGHCLDCDSAMNYSWETRDRVFVTRTDVAAVVRRFAGHTTEPDPEAPAHPAPSFDSAE